MLPSDPDGYNKSVLGKLAGVDPADLSDHLWRVVNGPDAVAKMRELTREANKSRAAKEGLRRAMAEVIERRFVSNKEVGASGDNAIRADAFATFMKAREPALRLVFDGPELVRMRAIVDDIKRSERSLTAVKDPAGPNTASDLQKPLDDLAQKAGRMSLLQQLWASGGAGAAIGIPGGPPGMTKGALIGVASAYGKHVVGSIRAAGLKEVDRLVVEAMLNPALGKAALMRVPLKKPEGQKLLSQALGRVSPFAITGAVDP